MGVYWSYNPLILTFDTNFLEYPRIVFSYLFVGFRRKIAEKEFFESILRLFLTN